MSPITSLSRNNFTWKFRSTTYCKRVPFVGSDAWYVKINIIPRMKVKIFWLSADYMCDVRRQQECIIDKGSTLASHAISQTK